MRSSFVVIVSWLIKKIFREFCGYTILICIDEHYVKI